MPRVTRTPQARLDLVEIALYIAEDNLRAADKLLDRFPTRQVRVPMIPEPSARSLNLSTCAGIAVYEALRQIHTTQTLGISG